MTGNKTIDKSASPCSLNTAVLFLVFNRLDTSKQVFESIKQARPARLYIASDGARQQVEGENKKVQTIRAYITSNINWDCAVKTLFRDENLGCKYAVSGAIDWFFNNEEMGIILEDDCLPSPSFFPFCQHLLQQYQNDYRVSMITGTSYLFNEVESSDDYFFSRYICIWAWATWRSRWEKYDVNMSNWPLTKEKKYLDDIYYYDEKIQNQFYNAFDATYNNKVDTWDYQWVYKCAMEGGLCITPYKNLVSNIGFVGTRSSANSPFLNMQRVDVTHTPQTQLPLIHSYHIDKSIFYNIFYRFRISKLSKILRKISTLINKND